MEAEWIDTLVKLLGPVSFANPNSTLPILIIIAVLILVKTGGSGRRRK